MDRMRELAAELGCDVLWTEDLSDGHVIRDVRIRDPFRIDDAAPHDADAGPQDAGGR